MPLYLTFRNPLILLFYSLLTCHHPPPFLSPFFRSSFPLWLGSVGVPASCISLTIGLPRPIGTVFVSGVTVKLGTSIADIRDYALNGLGGRVVVPSFCTANPNKFCLTFESHRDNNNPYCLTLTSTAEHSWATPPSVLTMTKAFTTTQDKRRCTFAKTTTPTPTTTTTKTFTTTTTASTTTPKPPPTTPPPTAAAATTSITEEGAEGEENNDNDVDGTADLSGSDGDLPANTDDQSNAVNSTSSGCCAFAPFTSCNISLRLYCNIQTNCKDPCGGTWVENGIGSGASDGDGGNDPPAAITQATNGAMIAGVVIGVLILILLSIGATILGYKRCSNNTNGNVNTKGNIALASVSTNMITNQAAFAPVPPARGPLNNHSIAGSSSTDDEPDPAGLYYAEPVGSSSSSSPPGSHHKELALDLESNSHAGAAATYEYAPVVQTIQQAAGAGAGVAVDNAAGSAVVANIVYATYAPTPGGGGGGTDDDGYEMPASRATNEFVSGVVKPLFTSDAATAPEPRGKGGGGGSGEGEGEGDAAYEVPVVRASAAVVNGYAVPLEFNGC